VARHYPGYREVDVRLRRMSNAIPTWATAAP